MRDVAVIVVDGDPKQVEEFIADLKKKYGDALPYAFRGNADEVMAALKTIESMAHKIAADASQPNFEYRGAA